jgi:hypothetical protein
MPRFVILEHDHPHLHWDFLLEAGPNLRAWRLAAPPSPGAVVPAQANVDHRLFYLDHEGPVSGGRGTVQRWDTGEFLWISQDEDRLVIDLRGQRVHGRLTLQRLVATNWELRLDSV